MSQPNKAWLAVVLLLSSGVAASARSAVVETKLNLREGPGSQHRILVVMPEGATVTVGDCDGEWCRVTYRGQRGYASGVHLNNGTAAYAAAPAPPPVATKYDPDDEVRVLQWHDREWRDRYWREMEVRRTRR
jgi:uncharacterized protein YraI